LTLDTATFTDMARAAQEAGEIDFVVPLDEVGETIIRFCDDTLVSGEGKTETIDPVLERLRLLTNRDFRQYKPGTITRRIRHRMSAVGAKTVKSYLTLLDKDPGEHHKLLDDLQIGVTRFFRDPTAWRSLKKALRKRLLGDPKAPIRAWCAGCATGEEAYSVALLLWNMLGTHDRDVKIYATDADTTALEVGRRGIYSAQSVANVPRTLRGGFEAANRDFRVKRQIRKWVIFGPHDVTKNPPIFNLDLLVCRNVLIYFNPALQARVFQTVRYALKPNGILFLGKSEVPPEKEEFEVIDGRWRLYTLTANQRRARLPSNTTAPRRRTLAFETDEAQMRSAMDTSSRDMEHMRIYDELLLNALPSAIVAVDESYRVQTWSSAAERIFHRGSDDVLRRDFFHSVAGLPYRELKQAVDSVLKGPKRRVDLDLIELAREHPPSRKLRAAIVRLPLATGTRPVVIMIFDDITEPSRLSDELTHANAKLDSALRDVQQKNELLQTTNEELETANEELQATNEELETANEEHQATNEELETTIEEHQATNEELETTNEELEATNEELETTNEELHRRTAAHQSLTHMFEEMLRSVDIGMFALGPDRAVQHANRQGLEFLGVRKDHAGVAFDALKLGWQLKGLTAALDTVESDETVVRMSNVKARKRRTLDVTFAPLHDHEGAFAGYIVSLIDRTPENDGGARARGGGPAR
ncbi:PAS domain-containing protein, partial [bacterium]|nr:PAS domain-containing protein [bacterium]